MDRVVSGLFKIYPAFPHYLAHLFDFPRPIHAAARCGPECRGNDNVTPTAGRFNPAGTGTA
jgi:hypothetical protein